ncbi:MAG: GGDEF domain-containing protein [Lachnospiraceae bacterium]|nr:GGDEF domain-containing protein [Lachnospiraceae bacterium]
MQENVKLYQPQVEAMTTTKEWGVRITEMMIVAHTSLLVFFFMLGVYPMVAVNTLSLAAYFSGFFLIRKNAGIYMEVLVSEVLIHATLAIVFVGWSCGFQFYAFSMIPAVFFADHTIRNDGQPTAHPMLFSAIVIVDFWFCRFIGYFAHPIYEVRSEIAFWTSTFNGTMILLMLLLFSTVYVRRILEIENELVTNAEFDELTKLPNRHYLDRLLDENQIGMAGGIEEFSIAILDIDNFKKVNDRFGHLAGDQVLKKLAGILARAANDNEDVFAARWGGEEFMLLATGNGAYDKMIELTEEVRRELERSVVHFDYWQIVVTASIGVSGTERPRNFKEMTEEADKCLYEAKGSGKNKVIGAKERKPA